MQVEISVDLRNLRKGLSDVFKRQLPFATAQALTATAGHVGIAWQDEMADRLDRPTPFTLGSVAVRGARKSNLVATVYVKDIAAEYLAPFVDGGPHFLGRKRGLLTPKNVALNAYGNIPRGRLAALKAKRDVFVGPVKLKSGQVVSGVWQRRGHKQAGGKGGAMQLLIRFTDPRPVTQHLDFRGRAERAVREHFEPEFARAFNHAMATAR